MPASDSADTKKVVWMVAPYALPPSIPGGTRHYEMSLLLQDHGWASRVIATPYNHKTHQMDRPVAASKLRLDMDESGVPFTWVYSTPYSGNDFRRYINMAVFMLTSQIRARGGVRPDVVIGSSPHLLSALSAWVTAKRYRVPFVFEVRDLWPESLVQLGLTNPFFIRPLEMIEMFLYKRASSIVALTEGIADNIRGRIKDPAKVVVMPNAVMRPAKISPERRAETRRALGWQDNETIAIYAGAHGDANDLGQIVEAARKLDGNPAIRFVLLGDGPTKASMIEQANGLGNITFMDSVPKSEIPDILQSADIGLLTLKPVPLFEGARPNKLFDYMGAGIPVISTVKGEAEKVLNDAGSGFAVDPAALAEGVEELSSSPLKMRSMAEASFQHASNVQTREDVVAEFAVVLDRLVSNSPNRSER